MRSRLRPSLLLALLAASLLASSGRAAEGRGFFGYAAAREGRLIDGQQANHRFVPGSVLKLVVAAAALHHLGPDHRVHTEVLGRGELRNGQLAGDLVLVAAGDPTWNRRFFPGDQSEQAPLSRLARQLRERGLRRVGGDLVIDLHRFPGRGQPVSRPLAEAIFAYAAPATGLAVDENSLEVRMAPSRSVGEPARFTLSGGSDPLRLENFTRTVSKDRHGRGTVDFLPLWGRDALRVVGEYPISEPPYTVALSVPEPELHAGRAFAAALAEQGIELEGRVRSSFDPQKEGMVPLARLSSPPLASWLPPILEKSHNWYAEMLLRVLAAEKTGEGRLDEGLRLESEFLTDVVGLPESAFQLDDASGLSPYNLLTPAAVVKLLTYAARQPWREAFMSALARPGKGTLQGWASLPSLAAKTGTVRNALGLAGYLHPDREAPLAFAVFDLHSSADRGVQRATIRRTLGRWSELP